MLQDTLPEDPVKLCFNMSVCVPAVGYRTRGRTANGLETLLYLEGPRFMWSGDESELGTPPSNYVLIISNCLWDSGNHICLSVSYKTSYYVVGKSRN